MKCFTYGRTDRFLDNQDRSQMQVAQCSKRLLDLKEAELK